jgi:hypothetical protein
MEMKEFIPAAIPLGLFMTVVLGAAMLTLACEPVSIAATYPAAVIAMAPCGPGKDRC